MKSLEARVRNLEVAVQHAFPHLLASIMEEVEHALSHLNEGEVTEAQKTLHRILEPLMDPENNGGPSG